MIKYKYFFGSDERSLNFLNTIYAHYNEVKVVTLEPKKTGRGRKISSNPVQNYCEKNDIEPDSVSRLITKGLKEKIEANARELNFLPKTATLPI